MSNADKVWRKRRQAQRQTAWFNLFGFALIVAAGLFLSWFIAQACGFNG